MGRWRWMTPLLLAALLGAGQFVPSQTDREGLGRTLYLRHCAACHGERGKGDGPLAKVVAPPVPDLTEGIFKLRSTPSGTLPTDDDLRRIIGDGIPATPMFGVKGLLSDEELDALVAFTKSLCPKFRTEGAGKPITITPLPPSPELLALGRQVYAKFQCGACHGPQGDSNGPLAKTLRDSKGRPIRPLSLRDARHYKNGYTPADIFRTLMTGMDGTPMPSFAGAMGGREAWALAHFVHSLITNNPPPPREGTTVTALPWSPLPSTEDALVWEKVPTVALPLQSLWRHNRPESVQVQALSDGKALLVRLQWEDATRDEVGDRLDAVGVQVPVTFSGGVPSLFWGDEQVPVWVVRWQAGKGVIAWHAQGIARRREHPLAGLEGKGWWREGRWTVVLRMPLPVGKDRVPFAITVWDGGAGDEGERRSTTGWHWLTTAMPSEVSCPHN